MRKFSEMEESKAKITGKLYAIFRIDKKFKSIASFNTWEQHMERTFNVLNADPLRSNQNEIIIGTANVANAFKEYTKNVKLRKNGVYARDLLITASPQFFNALNDKEIEKWVDVNKKFILDQFGSNCIYACTHFDELSPHIHICVVPKYTNKKGIERLSNDLYFGGRKMYSEWQTKYAAAMKENFPELNRGIKGSSSEHVRIQQYYNIINEAFDRENYDSVIAKAQNSELLEKKIRSIVKTLENYVIDNETLENEALKLREDKETLGLTIRAMSEIYDIPQHMIKKIIKDVEDGKLNIQNKDKGREI